MTAEPAAQLGFGEKGHLAVGADADVVVFDPETIDDRATFPDPLLPPVGIDCVLIGGQMAAKNCGIVNGRCGRAIRG